MPKVCVHIATMNNARYLPCAIRSLAAEPYKDFETLIFDDGPSTDGSIEVIEREFAKLPHLKYKLMKAESHVGVAAARQRLLEASNSDYILILDGDDVLVPGNIEGRVAELDATPELAGIYGELSVIDEGGVSQSRIFGMPFSRFLLPAENRVLNPLHLIRRSDVEEAGGYKELSSNFAEDFFLWMRIAVKKDFRLSDSSVGLYRVHSAQTSKAKESQRKQVHQLAAKSFLERRRELCERLREGGSLKLEPEELKPAIMLLGILCASMPEGEELFRLLDLAMELAPDDYGVHSTLIGRLVSNGDLGKALSCAERFERRFALSPRIRMEAVALKSRILSGMVGELARVPDGVFEMGIPRC